MTDSPVCDFCGIGLGDHPWAEPAYDATASVLRPSDLKVVNINSWGEWLSCDECHEDIATDTPESRERMIYRMATNFIAAGKAMPEELEDIKDLARMAHPLFWDFRPEGQTSYRTNLHP